MSKREISKKVASLREFHVLAEEFGASRFRRIDKYFVIRRGRKAYAVNGFFFRRVVILDDAECASVLELFSQPLSFSVFLNRLEKRFELNYLTKDHNHLERIAEMFGIALLFMREKFIVPETYNEYGQLQKMRREALSDIFYPSNVYIIPSLECNFRCKVCIIYDRSQKKHGVSKMTLSVFNRQLKYLLKQLPGKEGYDVTFTFYGGEPLLNKSLVEYAARRIRRLQDEGAFGRMNVRLSLVTNGSLLNRAIVNAIKKYDISVGVSMDGIWESNDARRKFKSGKGTFASIMRGIDLLQAQNVKYGLSWTIGPDNIAKTPKDLEWISEHLGKPRISFNFMIGSRSSGGPFAKLGRDVFFKKAHAIYDKLRDLGLMEWRLRRYTRWIQRGKLPYWFYCGATGDGQLVFLPDGKIGICHAGIMRDERQFQRPEDMGNLHEDPVYLEWIGRTPLLMRDCYLRCNYFAHCPGGCAYRVEEITGDRYSTAEEICMVEQFFIERSIIELCESSDG